MNSMYFTEEHQLFRASFRDFLQKEVVPHIDKWEKTGKLPKYTDSLIRVFFIAHSDGHEKVRNLVNAMNQTEQVIHLIMKETSKGWSYSEEIKVKKRSLEKTG